MVYIAKICKIPNSYFYFILVCFKYGRNAFFPNIHRKCKTVKCGNGVFLFTEDLVQNFKINLKNWIHLLRKSYLVCLCFALFQFCRNNCGFSTVFYRIVKWSVDRKNSTTNRSKKKIFSTTWYFSHFLTGQFGCFIK